MSKFKIIEEGRILSIEKLNELTGGLGCNKYSECGLLVGHVSCNLVPSAFGYETCEAIGHGTTCNIGSSYSSCVPINQKVSCPANRLYQS